MSDHEADAAIPELTDDQRERFDALLQDAIDELPENIRTLVDQVPIVVLDEPSPEMISMLKRDGTLDADDGGLDLCGLHTGVAITERGVDDPAGWGAFGSPSADGAGPEQIHLFRRGICHLAGGWSQPHAEQEIYEEIRITLLHEIGHHYGLDEQDLDDLGYA
ncbi:MAG: metallopeptidase family protein [Phycisphaerales bacterium]